MRVSERDDGVAIPSDTPATMLLSPRAQRKPKETRAFCLTHPLEPSKFNGLAYTGDHVATKGGSRICRK
jgi:hypothetical protein